MKGFTIVEYCIEKKGEAVSPAQRVQLRFYGFETDGKVTQDTAIEFPPFAVNYLGQYLQKETAFNRLPVNTIGYIRLGSTDIMAMAQPLHFQLFYRDDPSENLINRDSAILDSMRVFSMIHVIDKDEAAAMFEEDNQTDWKELLDENPFPAMIELRLKSEYTRRAPVDSVKQLMHQRFPTLNIEQLIKDFLPDGIEPRKARPVFKFVVI